MFVLAPTGNGIYFFISEMRSYFYPKPADVRDVFTFCDKWHLYETDLVI